MQKERGFTLVEMLVALALTSMSALLLVGGLAAARTAWTRADRQAVAGEEVAAAQAVLRGRLEAMQPTLNYDASAPYVDLRGTAQMLSWDGPAGDAKLGPPRRWRLMLGPDGALTLLDADPLSTRIETDAPAVRGWTPSRLIGQVRGLDIAYFGPAPSDKVRRWQQTWNDRPTLPELVRVRLRLAESDRRVWPDLIAAPAATVTSACTPDPLTGRCRPGTA
jgi:general secretion pathway protein J